ncbi:MAG: hypothetical protein WD934_02745 [Gemmatimonadales bacterium]
MNGLLRYLPRHFLDLLMTRGAVMVVIGFLLTLPMSLSGVDDATPEQLMRVLREALGSMGLFYTLLASYGLVGADVRQGFYRFLFAKPVSPVSYYLLSYVATTIVFCLAIFASFGLIAVMVAPVWPGWPALGDVLADYFLVSGLVLVFSRLTNADWIFGPVILGVSALLRGNYPADQSALGKVLNVVLPPTDTGRLFPYDGGVNWEPLLIQLAYAAVLVALAMLIVRKLPMGSAR